MAESVLKCLECLGNIKRTIHNLNDIMSEIRHLNPRFYHSKIQPIGKTKKTQASTIGHEILKRYGHTFKYQNWITKLMSCSSQLQPCDLEQLNIVLRDLLDVRKFFLTKKIVLQQSQQSQQSQVQREPECHIFRTTKDEIHLAFEEDSKAGKMVHRAFKSYCCKIDPDNHYVGWSYDDKEN